MNDSRIIKRYNAYYHGWCLTFGEHTANYKESRNINWLYGEEKIGLIISPGLRRQAQLEFLGHREGLPELGLSADTVRVNKAVYQLKNDSEKEDAMRLKDFLLSGDQMHMFLCSHLFYPRTRIITFSAKKPIAIMYKEMQPLKLIVE